MTLLEVVIAMFVLVVLFGAALSGVVSVNRLTVAAKNRTRAVAVLNQKMEEMRAITFANLNAKMTATPPASSSAPATFTGGYLFSTDLVGKNNNYAFHWTRELQTTGDDVGASLIKVKVTVEWAAGQHKIAISSFSYFSQFGVSPRA